MPKKRVQLLGLARQLGTCCLVFGQSGPWNLPRPRDPDRLWRTQDLVSGSKA